VKTTNVVRPPPEEHIRGGLRLSNLVLEGLKRLERVAAEPERVALIAEAWALTCA
jgi:hypothetical protein